MSDTDASVMVQTAVVVGVGLIGGSLALAWREAGFAGRVIGVDTGDPSAAVALQRGLVDEIAPEVPDDVDLIAVCTSSDQIAAQVAALAGKTAVILDVGSVKAPVLEQLEQTAGGIPANFVPCHPISGSERSGPRAAHGDLFKGATVVITPHAALAGQEHGVPGDSAATEIAVAEAAWRATGAHVAYLAPADHDRMLAVTSHLPHLLAFAFMQQVTEEQLPFTGGGFRDFTRIAAASPELWWRIMRMNRGQLLSAAEAFTDHLQALTQALATDDVDAGMAALRRAAELRHLTPEPLPRADSPDD